LLNALEIPKLHNLIYKEFPKFKIWNNLVHTPLHLPLWATPVEFKQDVESSWNSFKWKTEYADTMASILGFMNSKDINKETFDSNLEILYKTDKFRNETLSESIPEIKKYLPS
jgi:hypothetical protein